MSRNPNEISEDIGVCRAFAYALWGINDRVGIEFRDKYPAHFNEVRGLINQTAVALGKLKLELYAERLEDEGH